MRKLIFAVSICFLGSSCSAQHPKLKGYLAFKEKIQPEIFSEFHERLPIPFEKNLMAFISFPEAFNFQHACGVTVVYDFDAEQFAFLKKSLAANHLLKFDLQTDSIVRDTTNQVYFALSHRDKKIALPKPNELFCDEANNCLNWDDLQGVVLSHGSKPAFVSSKISLEYVPKEGAYDYTVGALFSEKKQQIIYWLIIY